VEILANGFEQQFRLYGFDQIIARTGFDCGKGIEQ